MKKPTVPAAEQATPENPRAGAQRVTYFVSDAEPAPQPQPATVPADDADPKE